MEKLGIDKILALIDAGIETGQKVADDLSDGKISIFEALGLAPNIFKDISLAKTWPDVKEQLADLSADETIAIEQHVMEKFNIPNARVKKFVDHAVMQIVGLGVLVDEWKHLKDPADNAPQAQPNP